MRGCRVRVLVARSYSIKEDKKIIFVLSSGVPQMCGCFGRNKT